jgi:hypothetical protein
MIHFRLDVRVRRNSTFVRANKLIKAKTFATFSATCNSTQQSCFICYCTRLSARKAGGLMLKADCSGIMAPRIQAHTGCHRAIVFFGHQFSIRLKKKTVLNQLI